jgi:chorismate mutase/prephenate dehydratase
VLGRGPSPWSQPSANPADDKTTILLVLGDRPGDLCEALRPLNDEKINLTKIESRPSKRQAWQYVFFLDLEGHRADPRVARALERLAEGRTVRVLGSYRKADEA